MADDTWFIPKSHGYGASPKNWKGWAAMALYTSAIAALTLAFFRLDGTPPTPERMLAWFVSISVLTAGFVWLARRKTDGEWRWRWGRGPFGRA